jgi:hypothetical protein
VKAYHLDRRGSVRRADQQPRLGCRRSYPQNRLMPRSDAAATCTVSRAIRHPNIIRAHATARPHQKVTVTWSMTCTKRKATASFIARTPASRKLRQPFRHPRFCTVTAATQLASSGHLHAWLTPRR